MDGRRGVVPMNAPWFAEPGSAAALIMLAALYAGGTRRVKRSGARVGWFRPTMFAVGWVSLAIALLSPLHPAGEVLVSAHMAQHTLLVLAPLSLVAGRAGTRIMQALAPTYRSQLLRRFSTVRWFPLPWWSTLTLMAGTIVVWHVPGVFEVATDIPILHAAEHFSLIVAAALYWSGIVAAGRRTDDAGVALASLFVLFVGGAAAGALFIFAAVPWYPEYIARAASVGVEWFDDQQMAGVIMSVPMAVVLMGVAAWLGWCWSGAVGIRDKATFDAPVE